jgi:hypothetical protein
MTTIRIRRGVAYRWTEINPILADGEPGFETDTRKLKIGDGHTPWKDLPYSPATELELPPDQTSLSEHIFADEPHPVYDNGPSLALIYQNIKV